MIFIFNLILGLVWIIISVPLGLKTIVNVDFYLPITIIILLFITIGIWLTKTGFKEVKSKKQFERGEIETYAIITNVYYSGEKKDGYRIWQADFNIIDKDNQVKVISQKVGKDRYVYSKGDYFKIKYYNGIIKILNRVDELLVPNVELHNIRKNLDFSIDKNTF